MGRMWCYLDVMEVSELLGCLVNGACASGDNDGGSGGFGSSCAPWASPLGSRRDPVEELTTLADVGLLWFVVSTHGFTRLLLDRWDDDPEPRSFRSAK